VQKLIYSTSEALIRNPLVEAFHDADERGRDGVITVFCQRRPVVLIELDQADPDTFVATALRGVEYTDRQSQALVAFLADLGTISAGDAREYENALANERTAKHYLSKIMTRVDESVEYRVFVSDLVDMVQEH
jgi:hypothetical protein